MRAKRKAWGFWLIMAGCTLVVVPTYYWSKENAPLLHSLFVVVSYLYTAWFMLSRMYREYLDGK